MSFSQQDQYYMQMAFDLATQGRFTTSPNPSVGCVLVNNNEIVGKGFHFKAGQPHAEVMALAEAGHKARGATAYVTLEPCSHYGRTPPCAKGLIEAGVSKVIAAMLDPNPMVAGKGMKLLADAGIEVAHGLLQQQGENLNKGFLHRMRTAKPFVQLKLAMSLDGRTAMANGESKWITGCQSRSDVQLLRSQSCAILSTSATVLADDPSLNVRWQQLPDSVQQIYPEQHLRQPVRVILDSQHRVKPEHQLFKIESPVWLVSAEPRDLSDYPEFCQQIIVKTSPKQTALCALMEELANRQINVLWVEAGANLAGALIEQKLVNELILYVAPKLLGDLARGLCKLPSLTELAQAPLWTLKSTQQIGDDLKLIYQPK